MGLKYIMLQWQSRSGIATNFPIIFPDKMVHADIAKCISAYMRDDMGLGGKIKVVSAGDITIDDCLCDGKSETLKIESKRKTDDDIIKNYNYLHGIVP